MNLTLTRQLTCCALIALLGACSGTDTPPPTAELDAGASGDADTTRDPDSGGEVDSDQPDSGEDTGADDVGGDVSPDASPDAGEYVEVSRTADEPAGEDCPGGGMRTEVGLDTDRDGALGDDEVDASLTTFVCDPFDESLKFVQISAGNQYTCGVTTNGGAKCWGDNSSGQLGDGALVDQDEPVDVVGLTSGVAQVAAGDVHTCALLTNGGAKCWGGNASGQLGDGSQTQRLTPVDVTRLTSGVAAITTGDDHTCAITTSGDATCWGLNDDGQLGDGSQTSASSPVNVSSLRSGVLAISAGARHTCAILTGGGATCWGDNDNGQLGDDSNDDRSTPVDVVGMTSDTASISAGGNHTCAVTTTNGAKCWGNNFFGALGEGTTRQRATPQGVSGLSSSAASISAGDGFTCAVTTAGAVECWGANGSGQLGTDSTDNETFPEDVSGLTAGVSAVSAGDDHTCAFTTDGIGKCWGDNDNGQLGLGYDMGTLTTPQDVLDD